MSVGSFCRDGNGNWKAKRDIMEFVKRNAELFVWSTLLEREGKQNWEADQEIGMERRNHSAKYMCCERE